MGGIHTQHNSARTHPHTHGVGVISAVNSQQPLLVSNRKALLHQMFRCEKKMSHYCDVIVLRLTNKLTVWGRKLWYTSPLRSIACTITAFDSFLLGHDICTLLKMKSKQMLCTEGKTNPPGFLFSRHLF